MHYNRLGWSGLYVTELCLGTMTFGNEADEATSFAMMDRFAEAGGNFLDTADVYVGGKSEEIVGRWLKGKRDQIVLASKFRFRMGEGPNSIGATRYYIMRAVERSLKRLDTDTIDLYQIHCWDSQTPVEETLRALDDLVHQGKVRYIGVSNYSGWQLMKAMGISERMGLEKFVSTQMQYSLIERGIEYEVVPQAASENIGILPWSPLGGGFLTGKYQREAADLPQDARFYNRREWSAAENVYPKRAIDRNWQILDAVQAIAAAQGASIPQVAIKWVVMQPGVTSTILGARSVAQLEDNLGALKVQLGEAEMQRLNEASAFPDIYPYRFVRDMDTR